jgi:hypothetical protein
MAKNNTYSDSIRHRILFALSCLLGITCLAAGVGGLRVLIGSRYAAIDRAPRVVLVNRPTWMSLAVADEIIDTARVVGIHSVFDQVILIETAKKLSADPWIKTVRQVRRCFDQAPGDTLEIDCDYRVPTALVKWQDFYWLVDGDGYKLPAQYSHKQAQRLIAGPGSKLALRIVEGVAHPPVQSGTLWPGDDLAAGLEVAKLLDGKPFAEQLPIVDVSNFGGRRDADAAHIVLVTTFGTSVRWGRPPSARDYFVEVPTSQKLQSLSDIFQQMHRVDGGQPWIDIRFDQVTYPSPEPAAQEMPPTKTQSASTSDNP